jgi:hypothetical protein
MILYPHLLQNNHVTPFWKTILERVSIGEAPFGTRISNDHIIFKHTHLPLKNSTDEKIIEFFKYTVGLDLQYIYFSHWKDIKRKTIKDNLVQNFIYRFGQKHDLNVKQTDYLMSMIQLFITLKKITPNDILLETDFTQGEYPHTYIKAINGLSYQNETIIFNPNHEYESDSDSSEDDLLATEEIIEDDPFEEDDNIE